MRILILVFIITATGILQARSQTFLNTAADSVRIWTITNDTLTYFDDDRITNIPVTTAMYGAGQLTKNVTLDTHGNATVEYKDNHGLLILRKVQVDNIASDYSGYSGFLSTYYINDNRNLLRFVIQPKGVAALLQAGWVLTDDIVSELCFRYEYDSRKRMIAQRMPGADWVYIVYDKRDRLVFKQDANNRTDNEWQSTLYDFFNRQVITGMIQFSDNRSALQAWVNANTGFGIFSIHPFTVAGTTVSIQDNPLPPASGLVALTITYYDNYDWTNRRFNNCFSRRLSASNNNIFSFKNEQASALPLGKITGMKVRVIDGPVFPEHGALLTTVNFYDFFGRAIQTQSDNYRGGIDTLTNLYDLSSRLVSTYLAHRNPAAGTGGNVTVQTDFEYDGAGRILKIWKTINDNSAQKTLIAQNSYNPGGQLTQKKLGVHGSAAVETLDYSYTSGGLLNGINKDYANNVTNNRAFGLQLNYDVNITSANWRGKSDGVRRAYNFTYDKANRLLSALFSQFDGTTFVHGGTMNFDVLMGDSLTPASAYDEDGNILAMKQWGFKLGGSSLIDDLQYTYDNNSNQIIRIDDAASDPQSQSGDFVNDKLGVPFQSFDQYKYDDNGNMILDQNKGIDQPTRDGASPAMFYNYMNLPFQAEFYNTGTIHYSYDALGNKLEKQVFDVISGSTNTTSYIGPFVYQNDQLQFILHEEGRTRNVMRHFISGDSSRQFINDYFVRDNLGNVRVVLTDQKDTAQYMATMETAYSDKEQALFANIPASVFPTASVPGGYPADNTTTPNDFLAKLNGNGQKQGPAIVLKVMSGDSIDLGVKSFYRSQGSAGSNTSALSDILGSLASGIVTVAGDAKGTITDLGDAGSSPLLPALNSFRSANNADPVGKPKAYLNWILLDEQFNYVNSYPQSGALAVGNADNLNTLSYGGIPVTKSGYLYVYVSNETQNWDVYFDNLSILHRSGPLLEETHYYPFGLTMAGISSIAFKGPDYPENKYKFNNGSELQNKEFSNGGALELYTTPLRLLDPQIGRWWQIDPTPDSSESPYASMKNNPILNNDPTGGKPRK